MTANKNSGVEMNTRRRGPRVHCLREICINYEGKDEEILVRPPNLSARGMFINTAQKFAEGTVLRVRFRLELTDKFVQARCEVRYCLPGVGVGVEFVEISPEAVEIIEQEIALHHERRGLRQVTQRRRTANPRQNRRRRS